MLQISIIIELRQDSEGVKNHVIQLQSNVIVFLAANSNEIDRRYKLMMSWSLPPLKDLPMSIYHPSFYPPPSHFDEGVNLVHPALIIPARQTGEIQKQLQELVYHEPKRKSVYALEEGVDYTSNEGDDYDPSKERKLALICRGCETTKQLTKEGCNDRSLDGHQAENLLRETSMDDVWQDERLRSLLMSGKVRSIDNCPPNEDSVSWSAPRVRSTIRKSYIRFSSSIQYNVLTVDQVLRRIIPILTSPSEEEVTGEGVKEIPSSFESAGHIAHVNLNEDALPYKYLIGKAILDKNRPKIRLVVNKIGNIENEFRTFPMEILASEMERCTDFLNTVEELCTGGNNSLTSVQVKVGPEHRSLMEVEMREHGCRFNFDFASVYWNSRLSGEHTRLVEHIINNAKLVRQQKVRNNIPTGADINTKKQFTIVADAMAGVGPFAIPLTSPSFSDEKTTMIVCHANDLNPVSYEYLQKNAKLNKCPTNRLHTYNLDARRFIHKMNEDNIDVDHFIMNLPQLAPEFLDAFRCWKFGIDGKNNKHRPMIHLHCFGEKPRSPDDVVRVERQVQQRCEDALGCPGCFDSSTTMMMTTTTTTASIESDDIAAATKENYFSVRVVRNISPRKNMLCVSFRLPLEVGGVEKLSIANHACVSGHDDDSNQADDSIVGNNLNAKRGNDASEGMDDFPSSKKLMRSS